MCECAAHTRLHTIMHRIQRMRISVDSRRRDSLPGPEGLTHRGCATRTTGFDHSCTGDRVIVLFVYDDGKNAINGCGNNNIISDNVVVCIIYTYYIYRGRVISRI